MKFKQGDEVRIRKNLKAESYAIDDIIINSDMIKFSGKSANIESVGEEEYYYLDIDNQTWHWTDRMLENKEKPVIVNGEAYV